MKIAIAGYGIEGKSNYDYFQLLGYDVTILDERASIPDLPPNARAILGKNAFQSLDTYDLVVRTPSLSPKKLTSAKKIWSATNEFFAKCPASIIGVTGTKGKGTVVSLIASIVRAAGKTTHVVGNIGTPALDILPKVLPNDIVVYELSSFQLWDIEKSPRIAVVLMIEPDHLDVHASFEEYSIAKQSIVRFQSESDTVVFTADNHYAAEIAASSNARKIPVQTNQTMYIKDGYFWYKNQRLCAIDALKLPGAHNQHNACVAIAAAWEYVQDPAIIQKGLEEFTGLPHRLKYVRTVNGVAYYDDSIATTIGSTIAAINSFNEPKIIILGGSSKGVVDFRSLAEAVAATNVKQAILIGQQAELLEEALKTFSVPCKNLGMSVGMPEIVNYAQALAKEGDVVILSPACASFGMFKNYADRGDQFIAAVNDL